MTRGHPIQPGLRIFQLLTWIDALDDGYDSRHMNSKQFATSANLAAYLLEEGACKDLLERKFTRRKVRKKRKEVFDYLQQYLTPQLYRLRGDSYLETPLKQRKEESNHLDLREGYRQQKRKIQQYVLTPTGKSKLERLEKLFSAKKKQVQQNPPILSSINFDNDVVIIPEEGRHIWKTKKFSVPRIYINGNEPVGVYREDGRLERF